jgi:hypothetical protein
MYSQQTRSRLESRRRQAAGPRHPLCGWLEFDLEHVPGVIFMLVGVWPSALLTCQLYMRSSLL